MTQSQLDLAQMETSITNRQVKVAVWGCGLLGTTNLIHVANAGFTCIGIDIDTRRVQHFNEGVLDTSSSGASSEAADAPQPTNRSIIATTSWERALADDIAIHLICVPTERQGYQYAVPLQDVVAKLARRDSESPILIIVESTIVPSWLDDIIIDGLANDRAVLDKNLFLGAAPRRDLFGDPNWSLRSNTRVIGGQTVNSLALMRTFYRTYCDNLVLARDAAHAMLSKVVENLFRYQAITLANQTMLALPGYDMTHVLQLAGTKWNMETYHPSLGIGGYCIPLAARYFTAEVEHQAIAQHREEPMPSVVDAAISFNQAYSNILLDRMMPILSMCRSIALLGASYIPNIKVPIGTITSQWAKLLEARGFGVGAHDPLMTAEELIAALGDGIHTFRYPDGLEDYDAVFVLTDHSYYRDADRVARCLKPQCQIWDNFGTWRALSTADAFQYYELGRILPSRP